MGADTHFDVAEADFERAVLERSRETPVLVDFWAPWCGPCLQLAPVLERAVAAHGGDVVLAKVNVDDAPGLADRYRVTSIPRVIGFASGAPAVDFTGVQPEPVVRQVIAALLPTEADRLAREAAGLEGRDAESRYRDALERDPRHPEALLGLARLLAERGDDDEALALADRASAGGALAAEAERLAAELRTRRAGSLDLDALRARLDDHPSDLATRLELGQALAAERRFEDALEQLLEVVKRDAGFADESARKAMLDVFAVLGPRDPLTERFRSELARALFR